MHCVWEYIALGFSIADQILTQNLLLWQDFHRVQFFCRYLPHEVNFAEWARSQEFKRHKIMWPYLVLIFKHWVNLWVVSLSLLLCLVNRKDGVMDLYIFCLLLRLHFFLRVFLLWIWPARRDWLPLFVVNRAWHCSFLFMRLSSRPRSIIARVLRLVRVRAFRRLGLLVRDLIRILFRGTGRNVIRRSLILSVWVSDVFHWVHVILKNLHRRIEQTKNAYLNDFTPARDI